MPQIQHILRTKETLALNYSFLLLNQIASILGIIYACHHTVWPMIIANLSACISSSIVIFLKYYYERSSARLSDDG